MILVFLLSLEVVVVLTVCSHMLNVRSFATLDWGNVDSQVHLCRGSVPCGPRLPLQDESTGAQVTWQLSASSELPRETGREILVYSPELSFRHTWLCVVMKGVALFLRLPARFSLSSRNSVWAEKNSSAIFPVFPIQNSSSSCLPAHWSQIAGQITSFQ